MRLFEEQAFTISRRFTAPIVRMRIMATATKAGLANDLESLRAGTLSEAELRAKCRERVPSDLLNAIWPNLEHYFADRDIRERDRAYGAMQDAELDKLVRLLRADISTIDLVKITFLGNSGP